MPASTTGAGVSKSGSPISRWIMLGRATELERQGRSIIHLEIRFADFQVDDAAALAFQFGSTAQHFKCSFTVHFLHPLGDPAFRVYLHSVDSLTYKNDHRV